VIYVLLEFDRVVKDVHVFMPFVLEKRSFVPVYNASPAIPPRVSWHRSISDLVSSRRASGLGFVAQPSNPTVLC
jgi:hypothetical protein